MNAVLDLKPCPFCGSDKLDFQYRQALDKKHRYGKYDAAIYCRHCYAYGARVKSENVIFSDSITREEAMKQMAIMLWNRRINE